MTGKPFIIFPGFPGAVGTLPFASIDAVADIGTDCE